MLTIKRTSLHFLIFIVASFLLTNCGGGGGGSNSGGDSGSAPGVPQNPSATAAVQSVTLQWSSVAGAASYNVYWSTTAGVTKANGTKIPNASSPYPHNSLTAGTMYYYVVTAVNTKGESAESAQVSATASAPSSDADLSSLTISAGVLNPAFSSAQTAYSAMFIGHNTVTMTPTISDPGATVTVNGTTVASGQASGSITLSPGTNTITVLVTAQDNVTQKTYTISAHYLAQQAYIKSSNTGTNDYFGMSVALYGDTLAVGAYGEASNATGINGNQADNSASGSGAVYVFTRTGTTWTQQAYIKASNTDASDKFGYSVALYGDTLAVGAPGEASSDSGINAYEGDNSAPYSGAVYVFTRTGTTWTKQAYIKSSNTGTSDFFGYSVALYGDTLAVGAFDEASNATGINGNQADNSAPTSGAVYVFTRTGAIWLQQAYIKASNTDANDEFGYSVALSGDTLAVGAPREASSATGINGNQADNSASGSGAVYVVQ